MSFIIPFSIGLVTSQLIVILLLLFRSSGNTLQRGLYAALLVSVECYYLLPLAHDSQLSFLVVAAEAAVPGVFWLFSASLFNDHFKLDRWKVAMILLAMLFPLSTSAFRGWGLDSYNWFIGIGALLLNFVFMGLALREILRYWVVDLVSSRRQLRSWFCVIIGLFILGHLFGRDLLSIDVLWLGSPGYLLSTLVWVAMNGLLLQFSPVLTQEENSEMVICTDRPVINTGQVTTEVKAVSRQVLAPSGAPQRIQKTLQLPPGLLEMLYMEMEDKYAYRDAELTIGQLAYRLVLPEHVLRTLINGDLGYRNFKDFLNSYRIKEACRRLTDTADASVPILTIALDAGFRSLSTFNRVFKDTQGVTPSSYRRDHTS